MARLSVQLLGIGLIGPGLPSWAESQAVLRGEAAHRSAPSVVPPSQRLPAAERRRAGASVKIAMAVAEAACTHAQVDPQMLSSVFTSSSGDGANCHALCEALASPSPMDRLISPTRFTNSVHNAPAGYWHITAGSRQASTSLCAYDDSFGTGLMAALTQLQTLRAPVLLVASDTPYPEPLQSARPLPDTMGVALVLAPVDTAGSSSPQARLEVELLSQGQSGPPTACRDASLEELRAQLPTAQALPLLESLARRQPASLVLPGQSPLTLKVDLSFPPFHEGS